MDVTEEGLGEMIRGERAGHQHGPGVHKWSPDAASWQRLPAGIPLPLCRGPKTSAWPEAPSDWRYVCTNRVTQMYLLSPSSPANNFHCTLYQTHFPNAFFALLHTSLAM